MRSEERRDVASRLRNGGIARNAEEAYTLILSCVGIKPQLPARNTYKDAMARLADLIDPTCGMEALNTGEQADYECSEHIMHCMSCNAEFGYVLYSEDRGVSMDDKPCFCPNCRARVVNDGN